MKHFNEPDFSDEEFPKISDKIHRLKHDKKEMFGMCKAVEDYAKKRGIQNYIEATLEYSDLSEDKIIEKVVNRFNITKEEAKEYYDECNYQE